MPKIRQVNAGDTIAVNRNKNAQMAMEAALRSKGKDSVPVIGYLCCVGEIDPD